jgi:squalene-hopene/tetraprenyl-beta-curcumene cyclase
MEETALAIDALADLAYNKKAVAACRRGAEWLARSALAGGLDRPAPVGLYFELLWYAERLYPVIWSAAALGRYLRAGRDAGRAADTPVPAT